MGNAELRWRTGKDIGPPLPSFMKLESRRGLLKREEVLHSRMYSLSFASTSPRNCLTEDSHFKKSKHSGVFIARQQSFKVPTRILVDVGPP